MFPHLHWSALWPFQLPSSRLWLSKLRAPSAPQCAPDIPVALLSLTDDSERRLKRVCETPQRLKIDADYGARPLHGRPPR